MSIFSDLNGKCLEVFMDYFTLFDDDFEDCLMNLKLMLERCEATRLVLNWEKCHFMVNEGIILGHKVTAHGIEVDKAKEVYKNKSSITKPLTQLLAKDAKFIFNVECLRAFELIKEKLVSAPIMVTDWSQPFEIKCDASDVVVGAVLEQQRDKMFRPIYYASRTLNDAQVNYATTEKEFFVVVFGFDKFRSYLVGSKVIVHTDHSALKYLLSKKESKPFEIREEFPDEQIFSIATVSERPPWYEDIANFLASGWLPHDLTRDQRRKLQGEVKSYLWDDQFLFKLYADGVIRRCVPEGEMAIILSHCHDGAARGHYGGNRIAAKLVSASRKDWFVKLDEALWAYRTAFKTTTGTSPFKLVYCKSCHLPVEIEHKAYWVIKMLNLDLSLAGDHRLEQMNELEEFTLDACESARIFKEKTKKWHDRLIKPNKFYEGDRVLLYNSRLRLCPEKFKSRWTGPYVVKHVSPYGAIEIQNPDGTESFKVNRHILKLYLAGGFAQQSSIKFYHDGLGVTLVDVFIKLGAKDLLFGSLGELGMTPSKKRRATGASISGQAGLSRPRVSANARQFDSNKYGFFFPSLIIRLCRQARVPEYKDLDGKVKREQKFRVDKVIIGKDLVGPVKANSDESDAPEEGNEVQAEDMAALPPHEQVVEGTSVVK
ncbi:uncharacterized protein [Nicotiana tomentosiformis]|uniref:uncharacterized protein n=1 Tax=Nicotiana tomentosiformis TaxID=4098 RepID=UPI00388CA682